MWRSRQFVSVVIVVCFHLCLCFGEVSFIAFFNGNELYWPAFLLDGTTGACDLNVSKVELYQSGGPNVWQQSNADMVEIINQTPYNRYAWNAYGAFPLPLTFRITKSNDEVVTFPDLVTRYDTNSTWYTGREWCPTPNPTSPPSTTPSPSSPPTTKAPTTKAPTTRAPTTSTPTTKAPTTKAPTSAMPSLAPPSDTSSPTLFPSNPPTTNIPSAFPSISPTEDPSASPTSNPVASGTSNPSTSPTEPPSGSPTEEPTLLVATDTTDDQGEDEDTDQTPGEDATSVSFFSLDDPRTIQILAIAAGVLVVCVCVLLLIYCKQRGPQKTPGESLDRMSSGSLVHNLHSESSGIQMVDSPRSQQADDGPNASVLGNIAMNRPPSFNTQVVINAVPSNTNVEARPSLPPLPQTLRTWLNEMDLSQYLQVFVQEGFGEDMNDLIGLTDADLKQMGIQAMAHRKRILKEIEHLKDNKGEGIPSNANLPPVPGPAVPGEGKVGVQVLTPAGDAEDSSSSEDNMYQPVQTTSRQGSL